LIVDQFALDCSDETYFFFFVSVILISCADPGKEEKSFDKETASGSNIENLISDETVILESSKAENKITQVAINGESQKFSTINSEEVFNHMDEIIRGRYEGREEKKWLYISQNLRNDNIVGKLTLKKPKLTLKKPKLTMNMYALFLG